MKELSPAEYRTALSVLAYPFATERSRMVLSGLPSSTYNLARRRIYQEGWITDRWVPEPGPCGFAEVEAIVGRPSASEREQLESSISQDPGCVVAFAGMHAVVAVFFREQPRGAAPSPFGPSPPGPVVRTTAARGRGAVPVYFDYSGLWARFGKFRVSRRYPQGLDLASFRARDRDVAAARSALPPGSDTPAEGSGATPWINLPRLPRSQLRAVENGTLSRRSVLLLDKVPAFQGRRLGEVILITGRRPSTIPMGRVLSALTRECGVFPFLFMEDERNILLAGVGLTDAVLPGRIPIPTARRPVMRTLQDHLSEIAISVEPVESLRAIVPFRHRVPYS